jgi:hypothetical protein
VSELAGIREEDGALRIGATTTHAAIAGSDVIRHRAPVLAEAAGASGTRRFGTWERSAGASPTPIPARTCRP